ncbi:hypothetical protein O6H91_Y046200 [Diphasiastrum complanatum]|nr:hypothetical protein O6H91_Y046200 [Diphasiastrum complanatum]
MAFSSNSSASSISLDTGKGHSKYTSKQVVHGYTKVKGKSRHAMEDYLVAEFRQVKSHELGLYAIYDGHLGHSVPDYLQRYLFDNILKEAPVLGIGGSTAVTAILIDGRQLLVANVGDSRAVLCQAGVAIQLSVDHEPNKPSERGNIEKKGGFVSNLPGDVPRVDGQLAVARAFGDKSLKEHLSADPDIQEVPIDSSAEFLILASDGLWKVMDNQDAVNFIRGLTDPQVAAKLLTDEALSRKSKDDISCIVVRFQ